MLGVIVGDDSLLWRVSSPGGGGRVGESTGLDNLKTTSSSSILIGTVCSRWSQVQGANWSGSGLLRFLTLLCLFIYSFNSLARPH